jgi:hypothetical protein
LKTRWIFGALVLCSLYCGTASAQVVIDITVDELGNGVGTVGSSYFSNDPGPCGLNDVLTYTLPFAGVPGDVAFVDPTIGGLYGDVLRFNGDGTMIVYSNTYFGADAPADVGIPVGFYPGAAYLQETTASDGSQFGAYTASDGQPGSAPGVVVNYMLLSDGGVATQAVPEPSPVALSSLIGAFVIAGRYMARRFKKKS